MKHRFNILVSELPKEDIEELSKAFKAEVKNDLMSCWGTLKFDSFLSVFAGREDRPRTSDVALMIRSKLDFKAMKEGE